jgi:hypothetical protein
MPGLHHSALTDEEALRVFGLARFIADLAMAVYSDGVTDLRDQPVDPTKFQTTGGLAVYGVKVFGRLRTPWGTWTYASAGPDSTAYSYNQLFMDRLGRLMSPSDQHATGLTWTYALTRVNGQELPRAAYANAREAMDPAAALDAWLRLEQQVRTPA